MFRKVLVANRGEIAVRIVRACHELGIRAVAVYSDADADAPHVHLADEAYRIGPGPSRQSYLHIPTLMNLATQVGADAIHPGYGFLSENPAFASICDLWGVTFIGPPAQAMRIMGMKSTARAAVQAAGLPIVPGSPGPVRDVAEAMSLARDIGYPLLVKASAGGGGRGQRVVRSEAELPSALERAASEALQAFGEGEVYLERYLDRPRHVEVQVMADGHGNVVSLGERDCSLQRKRQKILEEAPAPALDPEVRRGLAEAAVRAAQAVGYVNAGTVEFLVEPDGKFYFLEMNTRIQVEHPVTELVTGVDLVVEQIRVAAGEPLSFRAEDVQMRGHAVECRILAEDPWRDFAPSPGVITEFQPPAGPWVRVDSGVAAGNAVAPFYDSLLAKLITWGRTRDEALARMRRALSEFRVGGVATTIPLHERLLAEPEVLRGPVDTLFLERWLKEHAGAGPEGV